jgi:hypothetical protein
MLYPAKTQPKKNRVVTTKKKKSLVYRKAGCANILFLQKKNKESRQKIRKTFILSPIITHQA